MKHKTLKIKPFTTKKSVKKVYSIHASPVSWSIVADGNVYTWSSSLERVDVIRKGVPYDTIEGIGRRLNRPVKLVLSLLGIPQTTYNKKKSEHALLDAHESELIVVLTELIDYGIQVFNQEEEKFQRWLKKPNLSLGGNPPDSFLDTVTGIDEVNYCLNRIEFGNFA